VIRKSLGGKAVDYKTEIAILLVAVAAGSGLGSLASIHPIYAQNHSSSVITHGVASGDVTDHSAIIWSRTDREAQMNVQYGTNPNFSASLASAAAIRTTVNNTTDFTGKMRIDGLSPDTQYYYRVWFTDQSNEIKNNSDLGSASNSVIGAFRTSPQKSASKEIVSFVISGDLGGQRYCKRVNTGYPIFSIMKSLSPDFFIFNGDQIYADDVCPANQGPDDVVGWHNVQGDFPSVIDKIVNWDNFSQLQDIYNKHWKYNRSDRHLIDLLQNTSLYSQSDDHEVVNDYGGEWSYLSNETRQRTGFSNLVNAGIQAFFNFSPIDFMNDNGNDNDKTEDPNRIYRSFNWGKDLDIFLVDAHSYRSRSDLDDTLANNKTLLGKEQLQWLKKNLLNSTATWKVISTDVPFSIPSCFTKQLGCDSWATNSTNFKKTFTSERFDLLKFLDDNDIKNVVFVTTDVHFAANVLIDENPNLDRDRLILHEIVSGPLAAISYPTPIPLDPTINATYLYHENKIFNFAFIKIQKQEGVDDGEVRLTSEIRDQDGLLRPGSRLVLSPQ
jgi:alkaline phosphatase D